MKEEEFFKKIDMIQKVNNFVSAIKQRTTAARKKAHSSVTRTVTGTEEKTSHWDRGIDMLRGQRK